MAKKLLTLIQISFLIAGLVFLTIESSTRLDQVDSVFTTQIIPNLFMATLFTSIGLLFYFTVWALSFHSNKASKKYALPYIFFVGQIGKYIPGPMMGVVGQGILSKNQFDAKTGIFASLKAGGFVVVTGATLGSLALTPIINTPVITFALILGNIFAVTKLPGVIIFWLLRSKESVRTNEWRFSNSVLSLILAYGMWAFFGLGIMAIANFNGSASANISFFEALVGYSASHTAGILVAVAPAGIGIREIVFETLAGNSLGQDFAFLVATTARFVHIIGDALMAGISVLIVLLRKTKKGKTKKRSPD